jgi:hypothetical protein
MPKAKTKTPKTTTKAPTARSATLPVALAKRAAALSAGKRARLAKRAADLVALVRRRRTEISDAFYDMGEALAELKAHDMLSAMGVRTFAELCQTKLGISVSLAQQLVDVVTKMTREQAVTMGQTKAIALIALAAATPEADTAAELFDKGRVRLPGGAAIDARTASARAIERAAKHVRDAHDRGKPRRGRTTTAEERAVAAALQKALRAAGIARATVEAIATKPGVISDLRIAHLPIDAIATAARALAAGARARKPPARDRS